MARVRIAALPLLCLSLIGAEAVKEPTNEVEIVRAAARGFYQSLGRVPQKFVLAQVVTDADEQEFVLSLDRHARMAIRFKEACRKKFGSLPPKDAGPDLFSFPLERIATGTILIRGDDATIYAPGESPKDGIRMKRVNGVWKYRCLKFPGDVIDPEDSNYDTTAMTGKMADDIEAGVYPTMKAATDTWLRNYGDLIRQRADAKFARQHKSKR